MHHTDTTPLSLITRPELARLLRVSTSQIDRLKKAGELPPAVRIGGRDRWARADVAAWLTAGAGK